MKKFVLFILSAIIILTLCGCVDHGSYVGTWKTTKPIYNEYHDEYWDIKLILHDDGSYIEHTYNHKTDELINTEMGTWEQADGIDANEDGKSGDGIIMHPDNTTPGYIEYENISGKLWNYGDADPILKKVSD